MFSAPFPKADEGLVFPKAQEGFNTNPICPTPNKEALRHSPLPYSSQYVLQNIQKAPKFGPETSVPGVFKSLQNGVSFNLKHQTSFNFKAESIFTSPGRATAAALLGSCQHPVLQQWAQPLLYQTLCSGPTLSGQAHSTVHLRPVLLKCVLTCSLEDPAKVPLPGPCPVLGWAGSRVSHLFHPKPTPPLPGYSSGKSSLGQGWRGFTDPCWD